MHLIRRLPESYDQSTAVAIGNFDGLHRGHQAVIEAMRVAASEHALVPSVLTFEPHPRRFFKPDAPSFRIERLHDKLVRLEQAGVARVVMPRFDRAFASISAADFLDDVLAKRLGARVVVTGENFAFGHQRQGDRAMLRDWGAANGVEIITVPPVQVGEQVCSSSAVRTAITAGDMPLTARLLGRTHMLSGRVIHGDGRGATIGFPTANIALVPGVLLPAYGAYAVYALSEGMTYKGVANIGVRPTIGSYAQPSLEVHLFDFEQDIYGKKLHVFFVRHLRGEMKFDSIDALVKQLHNDCAMAQYLMGNLA